MNAKPSPSERGPVANEPSPPQHAGGTRLPVVPSPAAEGVNLNDFAPTRFLLTNRYVQPTVQIVVLGVFGFALWSTFFGPEDPSRNFGAIAFFGLWWTPVMLLSLLLFGRIWCYACPIGAITEFLQRFSLDRRFPTFRKPRLRLFGLGLSVLSIAAISFTLARLPLYKYGVATTPWKMGIYFLAFLAVAVGITLVFRQRAFCRYVCPATGVMSVTTRLSPFEIRQDRDSRVPDCRTAEFRSRYLGTERRCVACMHCSVDQPEVPIRFRARWPGAAAVRPRIAIPDEAVLALIVWAVFPIDHILGSRILAPLPAVQALPGLLAGAVPYYGSILATILAFAAVNLVGARWAGVATPKAFTRMAFAYLPLGIGFQLGAHLIPGLMENGGGLLNGFANGLGLPLSLPEAWASPETVAWWRSWGERASLWIAVAWSAAIAWAIARALTPSRRAGLRLLAPHLLLIVTSTWAVIAIRG